MRERKGFPQIQQDRLKIGAGSTAGDDTAAQARSQPAPTWRGFASCDFCGERLRPEDQLSGACPSCARLIEEQDATG